MLALLLVSLALGLSSLAASAGIGISGVAASTRLRVGIVFGPFETGMPIIGLLLGQAITDFGTNALERLRWHAATLSDAGA